ncbi:MAG TPA: cytochrome c3 family protein [Deferrisomatales bacterium]|nr:cytochrome c3 family protein [Deferrisomatales bacterium]
MALGPRHTLGKLLCAGALLLGPGHASGGEVLELLAPLDQAVVTYPSFHLVYTTRQPLTVRVELDGTPLALQPRVTQEAERYIHHLRVPVEVGRHDLRLVDSSDGSPLGFLSVSRVNPFARHAAGVTPPRHGFHTPGREASCAGCHPFPEPRETQLDAPTRASVVCGTCHPTVRNGANVHGPVAVGACYTCHDPAYAPARFTPRPMLETCGSCHADVVAAVLGNTRYAHGPAAAGDCTSCHSPHSGETAALLQAPLLQLCLGCHGDTLPRPLEESLHGNLSCTACHSAHGGDNPALTYTAGNGLCTGCHRTIDPVNSGHPIMGHPVATAQGVGAEGRPVRCTRCHPPHGLDDVSKLDIVSDEKAQRRFCTGCHS